MGMQNQSTFQSGRYTTTVRDVLVAKAIQNGYNPFCRSTDAGARKVTEEMRAKVQGISVPKTAMAPASKNPNAVVRELKVAPVRRESMARREVVAIENFELVRRKSSSFSFGMLVSVMVTAMVLAMVVFSGSLINEEARRYSELTSTLENLQTENKTLMLELEEKNDLTVIEDLAKNELGMVKVAEAEQKYVSLADGNSIRTYTAETENTSVTFHMLNAFGEKISNFLEYLD